VFGRFGTVLAAFKQDNNHGFIRFTDPYDAQTAAFSMHNKSIFGSQIECTIMKEVRDALANLSQRPMVSLKSTMKFNSCLI
jgi:hypothetical protein